VDKEKLSRERGDRWMSYKKVNRLILFATFNENKKNSSLKLFRRSLPSLSRSIGIERGG
jgi:hypothetical protein